MPATSRSVVGMAHSYKKHYPATPALKENRIASKLAPTGPLSTGPCLRTQGKSCRSGPCPRPVAPGALLQRSTASLPAPRIPTNGNPFCLINTICKK